MNATECKEFELILRGMAEIHGLTLSDLAMRLYIDILRQYEFKKLRIAANDIMLTHTFHKFPLPAQFVEAIDGKPEDQARFAWRELQQLAFDKGYYESVTFTDPVLAEVIRSYGGWAAYGELTHCMDDKEFKFHELEFLKVYQAYARRGCGDAPMKFDGLFDRENVRLGYPTQNQTHPQIESKDNWHKIGVSGILNAIDAPEEIPAEEIDAEEEEE